MIGSIWKACIHTKNSMIIVHSLNSVPCQVAASFMIVVDSSLISSLVPHDGVSIANPHAGHPITLHYMQEKWLANQSHVSVCRVLPST
jgi:hypothetical protein